MNTLKTKCGKEIQGTLETIEGIAYLNGAERVNGELVLHYAGETKVLRDSQSSKADEAGERLFVDTEGHVYPESEIVLAPSAN